MLYQNVRVMAHSLRFIDSAVMAAAVVVTFRIGAEHGAWPREPVAYPVALFATATLAAFVALAERLHVYHARRTESLAGELTALGEVALYSTSVGFILSEAISPGVPPRLYLMSVASGTAILIALRVLMRAVIWRLRRRGNDTRTCLILGDNVRTNRLVDTIMANPHFGIVIAGVVDLEVKTGARAGRERCPVSNPHGLRKQVLADVEQLRPIVGNNVIDEVFVTLPLRSYYDEIQQVLDICGEAGISVKVPPEAFERTGSMTEVSHVGRIPMVTHFNGPSDYMQLVFKRVMDVIGATVGLILVSPLLAIIAIAIKLTSPGPVFFVQKRVGLHGRLFPMVKFRSMEKDAAQRKVELKTLNETGGVAFKMRLDPRVTPVGRILRKFHLDELPQLWSVLIGDMSLVGPRPLPPDEANRKEWWQRRRLSMPPGLTCFWQVTGDHLMPFSRWMQMDLDYIDGWSLWLDLKLIASTFGAVAKGKGW